MAASAATTRAEMSLDAAQSDRTRAIVFLSTSAEIGGAERVLLDIVRSMREASPDRRLVVITSGHGTLIDEARALGATAIALPFPTNLSSLGDASIRRSGGRVALSLRAALAAPDVMLYLRRLRAILREQEPDIVHSNGAKMHLLSAFASRGIAPVVWHLHDYVSSRPFMRRALRACVARCSAVVANSASVAADARSEFGAGVRIHTVLNGVDLERCSMAGVRLDLDAGDPPDATATFRVRVGIVATFAKWKGHELFFKALATLPTDLPIRAYVVGGALYETRDSQYSMDVLQGMAASMAGRVTVRFTGHVSDVPAAMRALDIVVHASSEPEPFGLVIAEAMACGRAIITAGSGGALELVDRDCDAIAVAPGDAQALGEAIARLARNDELRLRLGAQARESAERKFDRRRMATSLALIYASCATARPA